MSEPVCATAPQSFPWKAVLGFAIRIGGTGLLLWSAISRLPDGTLRTACAALHGPLAAASVLAYVVGITLAESARYWALGRAVHSRLVPFREWCRLYLESRPWFYLLPAGAGAEASMWAGVRKHGLDHRSCGVLVLAIRVWGLGLWALAMGLTLRGDTGIHTTFARNIASAIPFLGAPAFWILLGASVLLGCLVLPTVLLKRSFLHALPAQFNTLGFSLSAMVVTVSCTVLAAAGTGVPLGWFTALGLIAALNFGMALPVSLGGLGLQEAFLLLWAGAAGLPTGPVLAFSAVIHFQRIVLAILGGGIFMARRRE